MSTEINEVKTMTTVAPEATTTTSVTLSETAKHAAFDTKWQAVRSLEDASFTELEENYELSPKGIFKIHLNRRGKLEKRLLTATPVLITGFYREPVQQILYAQLELYRRHRWEKLPLQDLEVIATTSKITGLAKYGVAVNSNNARDFIAYLDAYRNCVEGVLPENITMTKLGWYKGSFYLPGFKDEGVVFALGDPELQQALSEPQGEALEWLKAACRLREESVYGRLILATSFASPLLELLHFKGNPLVMLRGEKGMGKTTIMRMAATAWGSEDLIYTCNGTVNGFEMREALQNGMTVFADELQTLKHRKDFKQFTESLIYNSFGGVGKLRATKEAEAAKVKRWHNFMVLSSEVPILDEKSLGGQKRRLLEVDVKEPLTREQIIYYNDVSAENYGWAGRRFLEFITLCGAKPLQAAYRRFVQELHKLDNGRNEDTYVSVLAIIALADAIEGCLFFKEEPQEGSTYTSIDLAVASAMNMCAVILEQVHNESDAEVARKVYEDVLGKIVSNFNSFGIVIRDKKVELQNSSGRCSGFIWGDKVYIIKTVFEEWTQGYNKTQSALRALLKAYGYLFADAGRNSKVVQIEFNGTSEGRYICLPYKLPAEEAIGA